MIGQVDPSLWTRTWQETGAVGFILIFFVVLFLGIAWRILGKNGIAVRLVDAQIASTAKVASAQVDLAKTTATMSENTQAIHSHTNNLVEHVDTQVEVASHLCDMLSEIATKMELDPTPVVQMKAAINRSRKNNK